FKMASRERPSSGFFRTLNSISSVDGDILTAENQCKRRRRGKGPYWEVERLVDKRTVNGAIEYLVKWRGYSAYQALWEPEESITKPCVQLFLSPKPVDEVVDENVTSLRIAVERHLKAKSRLPVRMVF
ncbi:hypothetical protein ACROYT_G042010, partial [Oculina patagonica]